MSSSGRPVSAWDQLVSGAVVGTERRPVLAAEVLAAVPLDSSWSCEERLLGAASWLAAQRRAGWRPARAGQTVPPAPADTAPEAPPGAVQMLSLLLSGTAPVFGRDQLVSDWLELCAGTGRRLPHELVPQVLDRAGLEGPARAGTAGRTSTDSATWTAIGERGRWLAGFRPDRERLVPRRLADLDMEALWAAGGPAQRRDLLASLREEEPARGREMLEAAWPKEPSRSRAELLGALGTGLSGEDEPFLEAALDDRAGPVRLGAARLLDRLPASRRAQRMAARTLPLVARVSRRHLRVELPGPLDAQGVRDGLGGGGRAGADGQERLREQVAGTPLQLWAGHLQLTPAEAVQAAYPEHKALLLGWVAAALAQQDRDWARALVWLSGLKDGPTFAGLGPLAGQSAMADALVRRLQAEPKLGHFRLSTLLDEVPRPWPLEMSVALVRSRAEQAPPSGREPFLAQMAVSMDVGSATEVEHWVLSLPEAAPGRRAVTQVLNTLALRRAMAEELR